MKFRYQKLPLQDSHLPWTARPLIPVTLHRGSRSTRAPYYALLDSGADSVLFPADLARTIGISDVSQGRPFDTIGIAGQRARTFYHEVELQVLGDAQRLKLEAGFSESIYIPILGRSFFRHFTKVVFAEAKSEVELIL